MDALTVQWSGNFVAYWRPSRNLLVFLDFWIGIRLKTVLSLR